MIIAAIFSSWTAILRGKRVGLDAAAAVQRSRIVIRTLEDSLASAQCFVLNAQYYGFVAENGQEASLSFVARLSKSFPRGGRFGDFDVRRLTFSVEPGPENDRQLVLRQNSVFTELDIDEKEHPLVLAKNVRAFQLEFWDARRAIGPMNGPKPISFPSWSESRSSWPITCNPPRPRKSPASSVCLPSQSNPAGRCRCCPRQGNPAVAACPGSRPGQLGLPGGQPGGKVGLQ